MAILARNEKGEVDAVFFDTLLQALWDGNGGYLSRESFFEGENEQGKEKFFNILITFSRLGKEGRAC